MLKHLLIAITALLALILLGVGDAHAAEGDKGGGWQIPGTFHGSHGGACNPHESQVRFITKDYDANTAAEVDKATVELWTRGNNRNQLTSRTARDTATSPWICVNPSSQYVAFHTTDDNFDENISFDGVATPLYSGMRVTYDVHVRSRSLSPEYGISNTKPDAGFAPSQPVGSDPEGRDRWINYDPRFEFSFDDIPSRFQPMTELEGTLYVSEVGAADQKWTKSFTPDFGTLTYDPRGLSDGMYSWGLILQADEEGVAVGNARPRSDHIIGSVYIDRVNPNNTTLTHAPQSVTSNDTVTIDAEFKDVASGLDAIEIYVDGTKERTCSYKIPFASANTGPTTETCSVDVGPFSQGDTHSYYAKAVDQAENTSMTSTQSFTVGSAAGGPSNDPPHVSGIVRESVYDGGIVTVNVASNVSDPDGDSLTITNKTVPLDGTVSITDDLRMSYNNAQGTPYGDNGSPDTFEYQISDGNGGTATGTVEVDVDYCGDGNLNSSRENCEPPDTKSCGSFSGFSGGNATCSNNCDWDTSACMSTAVCSDGTDNDGDGVKDANDPGCWTDPNDSSTYDSSGTSEDNCGNGVCERATGENPNSCPADCQLEFEEQ